jgi:DNA mismatch endonuclease, patch repair protein
MSPKKTGPKRRWASKPEPISRSENMRRIRSKDTTPELMVRRLLYRLGYRYRLHYTKLPGKPDIVFPGRRKVIFVHGCFWHAHQCRIAHQPRTKLYYWSPKLARNVERDARNQAALLSLGWETFAVWECQTRTPSGDLEKMLVAFLGPAHPGV